MINYKNLCFIPQPTDMNLSKPKKPRVTVKTMGVHTIGGPQPLQRTLRKSTQHVSQEYKKRFELEEEEQRRRRMYQSKRTKPERKLTQKELLQEAKITERENLASLEAYSLLEAQKQKVEKKKTIFSGPVIRFHSMTMSFQKSSEDNNKTIDHTKPLIEPIDTKAPSSEQSPVIDKNKTKYCRNFLVFTDTQGFPDSYFPTEKPKYPRKRFCPITGLPAKYVDPLTSKCCCVHIECTVHTVC